jgi:hypothetical protein
MPAMIFDWVWLTHWIRQFFKIGAETDDGRLLARCATSCMVLIVMTASL